MNRYEIAIESTMFETCKEAFKAVYNKEYDESLYACYNEEIGKRKLCPFAENDSCRSKELQESFMDLEAQKTYSGILEDLDKVL